MDNVCKVKVDDRFTMCMLDTSIKEAYNTKKKIMLLFDLRSIINQPSSSRPAT